MATITGKAGKQSWDMTQTDVSNTSATYTNIGNVQNIDNYKLDTIAKKYNPEPISRN